MSPGGVQSTFLLSGAGDVLGDIGGFISGPPGDPGRIRQIAGLVDALAVTAEQDVSVTAFVGWVGGNGSASYECVLPGGGLGGTILTTQAQAENSCSQAFADALVDTPLPPKPVYQIRAIPVA